MALLPTPIFTLNSPPLSLSQIFSALLPSSYTHIVSLTLLLYDGVAKSLQEGKRPLAPLTALREGGVEGGRNACTGGWRGGGGEGKEG